MNHDAMTYLLQRFTRPALMPALAMALACATGLTLSACQQQSADAPPLEGADIGGPFTLMDKDRKPVTWDSFKGKWRIVYFGYTFCPDACPMDVQAMMRGFTLFEEAHAAQAAKVQPIFISIDPARDTPEVVGEWSAAFGPRLLGLTGTAQQIDQAAKAFASYYKKGAETSGGYLMDHSRIAYLMDPEGKPIAMLPIEQSPEAVSAELTKWVK